MTDELPDALTSDRSFSVLESFVLLASLLNDVVRSCATGLSLNVVFA
jgi:hypothetical protein